MKKNDLCRKFRTKRRWFDEESKGITSTEQTGQSLCIIIRSRLVHFAMCNTAIANVIKYQYASITSFASSLCLNYSTTREIDVVRVKDYAPGDNTMRYRVVQFSKRFLLQLWFLSSVDSLEIISYPSSIFPCCCSATDESEKTMLLVLF